MNDLGFLMYYVQLHMEYECRVHAGGWYVQKSGSATSTC